MWFVSKTVVFRLRLVFFSNHLYITIKKNTKLRLRVLETSPVEIISDFFFLSSIVLKDHRLQKQGCAIKLCNL